jgi:hypothetical protein
MSTHASLPDSLSGIQNTNENLTDNVLCKKRPLREKKKGFALTKKCSAVSTDPSGLFRIPMA